MNVFYLSNRCDFSQNSLNAAVAAVELTLDCESARPRPRRVKQSAAVFAWYCGKEKKIISRTLGSKM